MNLADLQREAHAIAKEHGWWDEERTFGDCIALGALGAESGAGGVSENWMATAKGQRMALRCAW